jgi:hypothetical protein
MLLLAVLLVGLALLLGIAFRMAPLGAVVFALDPPLLNTLQAGIQRNVSVWLWDEALLPVLEAPSWAVPLALGLLLLGIGLRRRRRG